MRPHWKFNPTHCARWHQYAKSEYSALCQVGSVQESAYFQFYVLYGADYNWIGIYFNNILSVTINSNRQRLKHSLSAVHIVNNLMVFNYLVYIDYHAIILINLMTQTQESILILDMQYFLFLFWINVVICCSSSLHICIHVFCADLCVCVSRLTD